MSHKLRLPAAVSKLRVECEETAVTLYPNRVHCFQEKSTVAKHRLGCTFCNANFHH